MSFDRNISGPTESTRLLEHSIRIARENETLATNTIEAVMEQGERLDHSKDQVDAIKDMSVAARTSVNALKSKIFNRKLQLWAVIIFLLFVNALLIVRMYYHHGSLYS